MGDTGGWQKKIPAYFYLYIGGIIIYLYSIVIFARYYGQEAGKNPVEHDASLISFQACCASF